MEFQLETVLEVYYNHFRSQQVRLSTRKKLI